MNTAELAHGLSQILQSYSRAGIQHLHRQRPSTWDATRLTAFLEPGESCRPEPASISDNAISGLPQPVAAQAATSPNIATPGTGAEATAPFVARAELKAAPSRADQPLGRWQLPVLAADEKAAKLAELDAQVKACRQCAELIAYRRQTVFGEGTLHPRVCFYGEAPGADEDAQGRPFVGAAGKLLTDIIRAMKLAREEVYILNSLKCRPPQNRTPLPEEVDSCRPYAHAQLEILQPEFLILLGAVAVRSVLQSTESVGRLRGRFHSFHGARVLVTYHPAYLLRTPAAKKMVWEDVQLVMRELSSKS